ncbi:MAG: ABC transporter substrate binding protein, partial [Candidatus Binatia bacterium]
LARPGGNMTGLSFSRGPDDVGKQLSIFHQVVPSLKRIVAFYDGRANVPAPVEAIASLERVAHHLKIRMALQPVESMRHAASFVEGLPRGDTDGVFLVCGQVVRNLASLTAATDKAKLPVFGCNATQVAEDGALATYSPNIFVIGYRAAWYVDRLFKGYQPKELPVEQPNKLEWIVNLKRAQVLGIGVPQKTLILTDRVIQ